MIYTPEDIAGLDYNKEIVCLGEEPYTRGIYPTMYRGRSWTIRQFSGLDSAEATNKRFKMLYDMGTTGFAIAMDEASLEGFDPDSPEAEFEVGVGGVNVFSMIYLAMAENRGIDLRKINGTTEGDPTTYGGCIDPDVLPVRQVFRLCGDLVEWCAINVPKRHPVSFTSYNFREAGVNAYQEIGGLLASAVAIIEEVLRKDRGLSVDDFVPQFAFHLSSDSDFFEEIAKMRATRRMWSKLIDRKI